MAFINNTTKGKQNHSVCLFCFIGGDGRRLQTPLQFSKRAIIYTLQSLWRKLNDFIERHHNNNTELDAATFTDLCNQLQRKDTIISNLNDQKLQANYGRRTGE